MASTYVNDLRLNEMGTGDESGNWGVVTNTNLELIGEAFSYGTEGITTNADTHSTTIADGATDPGRSMYVKYTGTLDSTCTVSLLPNTVSKLWIIENATSGGYKLSIKQGSGAEVVIRNGDVKAVYSDGAGSGAAMFDALIDLNVGTKLSINNAGTGDGSEATLLMSTAESDIAANDIIGKIQFQAPDEGTGTDANLVAAEIAAVSEGDFSSSSNATKLSFKTGASEAAAEKMALSSAGALTVTGDITSSGTVLATGDTAAGDDAAMGYTSAEGLILTGQGSTGDVTVKNDADAVVMQVPTGTTGVDFKGNIFTTTAGTSNFVAGVNAGNTIESGGNYNVCVGDEAGTAITTGDGNVFIGYAAGDNMSTGSGNTFVGKDAGTDQSTASDNTLIGTSAGANITDGPYNTLVGNLVGDDVTSGTYITMIGYNLAASAADGENQITLGQGIGSEANNCLTFGKPGNKMFNNFATNNSWSQSSDERLKTDVSDNSLGLGFINDLETKTYKWKPSNEIPEELTEHHFAENQKETDVLMYGMMAQTVKAAMDKHNHSEFTGWSESKDGSQNLSREMFVIPLIKAVQELSAQVQDLTAQIEELKSTS